MHLKKGLIIRSINDEFVLIDSGIEPPVFNGMVKLNKTGNEIINLLIEKDYSLEELYTILKNKYDVDDATLNKVVNPFIEQLRNIKLINE